MFSSLEFSCHVTATNITEQQLLLFNGIYHITTPSYPINFLISKAYMRKWTAKKNDWSRNQSEQSQTWILSSALYRRAYILLPPVRNELIQGSGLEHIPR